MSCRAIRIRLAKEHPAHFSGFRVGLDQAPPEAVSGLGRIDPLLGMSTLAEVINERAQRIPETLGGWVTHISLGVVDSIIDYNAHHRPDACR